MILRGKFISGLTFVLVGFMCMTSQTFACTTPTGLTTTLITSTGATLNWGSVSGALTYKARYRVTGTIAWTSVTVTPNTLALTGLAPGTSYDWKVLTNCSTGSSSYSSTIVFNTLCAVPAGLYTTNITNTSAQLNWNTTPCDSFLVRYIVTSIPNTVYFKMVSPGTATSTVITGLLSGTNYSWLIRCYCMGGQGATYSSVNSFNTGSGTCSAPAGLTSSSITTSSATLSWAAASGASGYNIQYRIIGASSWTSTTSTSTSKSLTGLSAGSNYEFQLQTSCSAGGTSAWSSSATFTTLLPSCSTPSSLTSTSITTSGATLGWSAVSGAVSYNIQYRISGGSSWTAATSTTTSKAITGLTSGTLYEFQVQTVCSGNSSSWSSSSTFTTLLPACSTPSGLTSTSITTSGATLGWSAVSGAVSYNIQYRISGGSSWTAATSTTTSKAITGLTSGTLYEFQVQTVCSGNSSSWSSSSTFTTLLPSCSTPSSLTSTSITSSGATLGWAAVSGAVSYNIQYRITGGSSWTAATSTTTSKAITGLAAATVYEFQVQTVCSASSSSWSSSATFTTANSTTLPVPDHVVILIEENHAYTQIIGSASAPYINALAADPMSTSFTQMYGIEHPSQPNYLDLFAGSNQGITNNNLPSAHLTTANLARELINAGKTFITYSQSLPSAGSDVATSGKYARKHNPIANWMGTGTNQVSSTLNQTWTAFPTNYSTLPTVSYVVPDLDYDMHDGTVATGDTWFHTNLDGYVQWAKTHNSLFILVFDEDDGNFSNRIATIFTGPMVKSGTVSTTYNLYNLLRTIEDMYGTTHAGNAASVSAMRGCWLNGYKTAGDMNSSVAEFQWEVFPNPATDVINVEYMLEQNSDAHFIIYNNMGQEVTNQIFSQEGLGYHLVSLSTAELGMTKGIYFLEMIVNEKKYLKKIAVLE